MPMKKNILSFSPWQAPQILPLRAKEMKKNFIKQESPAGLTCGAFLF
jgi:hypothetical protein